MDPKKIEAILDHEAPRNLKQLQRFLGMIVWYGRFIKDLSKKAAPLRELLRKNENSELKWEIHVKGTKQNL